MAGLPESVLSRAKEILNHHLKSSTQTGTSVHPEASNQLSMFERQEVAFKKDLDKVIINKMTPMEALQKLDELKRKHGI